MAKTRAKRTRKRPGRQPPTDVICRDDEPATIPSLGIIPSYRTKPVAVQVHAAKAFAAFCAQRGFNAPRAAAAALVWFMHVDGSSRDLTANTLYEFERGVWANKGRATVEVATSSELAGSGNGSVW